MKKAVNVITDFGAKADGVTDDFKALQNALDSLRDGGTVIFPDGTYIISDCLIFYSGQTLEFSEKAVLKRMKLSRTEEPQELRYMLASYTENSDEYKGYGGTHDVLIHGGTFDGNGELFENQKITVLNTCHCNNITVRGSTFIHGAQWHMIELNSTANAVVEDCVFDGCSYTNHNIRSELIQLDVPVKGNYGPVFYPNGNEVEFPYEKTVCRNIEIRNNLFICNGFPAAGSHYEASHCGIDIHDNEFKGPQGERGYISFMPGVTDINIHGNKFEEEFSYRPFLP